MGIRSRVLPVLVAGLAVAGAAAGPATVAPSQAAGPSPASRAVIVFSTGFILNDPDRDHPSQVVRVGPGGARKRQLTHVPDGKQAGAPDLSPDGTTIVYVSNESGDNFAVWSMATDGSGQHRLFGRAGFDYLQPRWSPGGGRLVVTECDLSFGFRSRCDLVLLRPDGTHRRTLVDGGRIHGDARFSPNGRWVAFDSDRGGYTSTVWKIRVSGGAPIRLTRPRLEAFWPSWSPDGRHLVVSSNCCLPKSQVFTMRADGSHLRQRTHVSGGGGAAFASFSPNGRRIVFSSDQLRGPDFATTDLFVMRRDGSHVRRIVADRHAGGADWGRERS